MRRSSTTIVIVISLVLLAGLATAATGCGPATQGAGLSSGDLSPEDILAKAFAASQEMSSAKGSFELQVSFDSDLAQVPEEEQALLAQPIKVSGTLGYDSDPRAGDVVIGVSAAGQTMEMGLRLLGDKAWIRFMDQWYETPPEMQQILAAPTDSGAGMADVGQLLADLGVDPLSWLKNLRLVGEEVIDGAGVYHLTATPDIGTMMTDVVELMQSGELMKLVDPTGAAGDLMGSSASLPSAGELEDMQRQLAEMFQDIAVDVWVAKDGFAPLRFSAAAHVTPPPGEDAGGVGAIDISATVSLLDINQPVSVEPPASAKPWTELEKAMEENPGMFMGPFFGSAFGSAPAAPGTYQ